MGGGALGAEALLQGAEQRGGQLALAHVGREVGQGVGAFMACLLWSARAVVRAAPAV